MFLNWVGRVPSENTYTNNSKHKLMGSGCKLGTFLQQALGTLPPSFHFKYINFKNLVVGNLRFSILSKDTLVCSCNGLESNYWPSDPQMTTLPLSHSLHTHKIKNKKTKSKASKTSYSQQEQKQWSIKKLINRSITHFHIRMWFSWMLIHWDNFITVGLEWHSKSKCEKLQDKDKICSSFMNLQWGKLLHPH